MYYNINKGEKIGKPKGIEERGSVRPGDRGLNERGLYRCWGAQENSPVSEWHKSYTRPVPTRSLAWPPHQKGVSDEKREETS